MAKCRICKGEKFEDVLEFGQNTLVNSLLKREDFGKEETYPLVLKQCQECFLVQITDNLSGTKIYTDQDYLYFSSDMPGLNDYFKEFADDIKSRFVKQGDFILEIGANDGVFMRQFRNSYRVLGVDPAMNVVLKALKNRLAVVPDFFSETLAGKIANEWGKANVIMGANCIAHLDDLHDLMRGVVKLLDNDGVFIVECNYWGNMVKNKNYALVYHDHFSYFSLSNWLDLLGEYHMNVFDAVITSAQGGSLRLFADKRRRKMEERCMDIIAEEGRNELASLETAQKYAKDVKAEAKKLGDLVKKLKLEGSIIMGYGAAAKGFAVLTLAGITDEITAFVDDSPAKQGKYTPVTHIPILKRNEVKNPDYFLITAPNYKDVIIEKEKEYLNSGGSFITVESEIINAKHTMGRT